MNTTKQPRSKSPTYSHLLYLSDSERQSYTTSSSPSLRSSHSMRSNRSASSRSTTSTRGMSRISINAPRFADDHYPLITTIRPETVPESVPKNHAALWCARQMAQIHNTIIRALNASWNHAVSIQPSTQEAADFLFFNQQICSTLEHHHKAEDDYLFPTVEKMLDRPGAMEGNSKGHESFAEGLAIYRKYVFLTKPSEFNGVTLRHIIESFAPDMIQHLHDEIPTLVGLHRLDSKALMRVWKHAEHLATKDTDLYAVAPWMLGCQDRSFTIDGHKPDFPELPWILEVVARSWLARKYAGAWKFCPSDLNGRRRQIIVESSA
ncbi:hypothetical protein LTR20_007683 [Exophiala xenobiotica]|nr:hypothetical protein LTR40_002947 [Exophiala xenobiotica]KAK5369403.1 hypothetical protein LTS13_007124 [Exophiala xenobiotica]KAK5394712.1 hypothetical protein LTR79_008165 [Exophiala xenobiotica]KAK5409759.1 hypothetical protein LTR90_008950 [Exophiala xenobiotica]KAK5459014.1 hypothetical protein LTR20_007683 [Exophiala xenobiotica]